MSRRTNSYGVFTPPSVGDAARRFADALRSATGAEVDIHERIDGKTVHRVTGLERLQMSQQHEWQARNAQYGGYVEDVGLDPDTGDWLVTSVYSQRRRWRNSLLVVLLLALAVGAWWLWRV